MPPEDNKQQQPTAEEFTTDPKHKEAKDRLWSYFDAYVKQRTAEAKAAKGNQKSVLDAIINPASIFE